MRVWIINPFDNLPGEGYRPQRYWLMSEALAAAGNEVTFWTQDWSHANKARRTVGEREAGGGKFAVRYVHVPGYRTNISFGRLFSHWKFAKRWRAAAETLARAGLDPDAIIVSSPPLAIGGEVRKFTASHGSRYVIDIMDAWPETFERVAPRWMLWWLRRMACANYCGASGVTACARRYLELAAEYGAKAPQYLCHHGIERRGRIPARRREGAENFRLVYAGNMSMSYDLKTLIEAVRQTDGVELRMAGSGPDEAELRRLAGGCERIGFCGYLKAEALREELSKADCGVIPMFDESCVGVPYKAGDYADAGLPILNTLHGETEELLAKHEAGVTCKAGDAKEYARAILAMRGGDTERMRKGAEALAEKFDAKVLYKGYADFVTATCGKSGT